MRLAEDWDPFYYCPAVPHHRPGTQAWLRVAVRTLTAGTAEASAKESGRARNEQLSKMCHLHPKLLEPFFLTAKRANFRARYSGSSPPWGRVHTPGRLSLAPGFPSPADARAPPLTSRRREAPQPRRNSRMLLRHSLSLRGSG